MYGPPFPFFGVDCIAHFVTAMHRAWPRLYKRIEAGKATTSQEDRELITASRIWFCLYLFEHQSVVVSRLFDLPNHPVRMSYGTGRPAILKDDESIWYSRALLKHPLAIQDDMRLCSMLEMMAIRERIHNRLSPDHPVNDETFAILREADEDFRNWYTTWDTAFSQKYEDAAFYRQSLHIQQLLAELFHNAFALRGIDGPEDVEGMHPYQKQLANKSLVLAEQALTIFVNSSSYREGLKYCKTTKISLRQHCLHIVYSCPLYPCDCYIYRFLCIASCSALVCIRPSVVLRLH